MDPITDHRDTAEQRWRENLQSHYNSLWHDIPVEHDPGKYDERPWMFYTDLETIYTEINDEAEIQQGFEETVDRYWDTDPDTAAEDTLEYLLFHELYHPLEAPSSEQDRTNIYQSIREGLLESDPDKSPKEQFDDLMASENMVTDFILDNRFYVDNSEAGFVRDDIIPAFDAIALQDQPQRTDMYTITRHIYGALYGPDDVDSFFEDKTGSEGIEVAEDVIEAIIDQDIDLHDMDEEERDQYARAMRERFRDRGTRYDAVTDMMEILEPYITDQMYDPRNATADDAGTAMNDVLQDLLEQMDEDEQDEFLEDLEGDLESGEGDDYDEGELKIAARHEYYKNNHPEVQLLGEGMESQKIDRGEQQYLENTGTHLLTDEQLAEVDMKSVLRAQKRGLPMLFDAGDDMYGLNEYEVRDEPVQDIRHVEKAYTVPDVIEFYLDSSGSMFKRNTSDGFDDGSRWDMLGHALYGIIDAIAEAEEQFHEDCDIRIHNFADEQVGSDRISTGRFLDGDEDVLDVLYAPGNGGDTKGLDIQQYGDTDDRTHIAITDGDMDRSKIAKTERRKMEDRMEDGERAVMVEIGGTYNLGEQIQDAGLPYEQVHDSEGLMEDGLGLILTP